VGRPDGHVTIAERVARARARLRAAGITDVEAELDARLLAEHVLGWTTTRYLTDAVGEAPPAFEARYGALVERRARREPVAYIVRHQEFWGLEFEVSRAVLIPRPETELIVESALAIVPAGSAPEIADVCTGSGCIAVAIARERPRARLTATELSDDALQVAKRNAVTHLVAERIDFRRANLLAGVDATFDLVVSNPPYVPERDRPSIQPEVRDYEPALALFAGPDGLHVIRALLSETAERLRPGGHLVFEFGFGQADAVTELIARADGLTMIDLRRDLQGIPRAAIARKV
jgi:release factor glutamine methyltransferase